MFVILGARNAVTAPPAGLSSPPVRPLLPSVDRQTIYLLGVNGDVILLTGGVDGLHVAGTPAPFGFWIGEYESNSEATPGVDGARPGDITASARPVGLSVRYAFATVAERRAFADRLVRALNPKGGAAGFLVVEPDSSARMVTGRLAGSADQWAITRNRGTLTIELDAADDPFWIDAPGSELPAQTWRAPDLVDFYPYLPYNLVEAASLGDPIDVDNTGHEDISPDWLIHGPASDALLANDTTGESLLWRGDLAPGKWIAVITKPGMQEVVDSDGESRFHELEQDPEPAMWHLKPGVNTIRTVIGGVGEGTSVTLMDLTRRWLIQS